MHVESDLDILVVKPACDTTVVEMPVVKGGAMVSRLKAARLRRFAACGLAGAVVLAVLPARAAAQGSTSEPLAMELSELMSSAQLDAVAGPDPSEENRFVAALAFPGQLLVVSARYEVPVYIEERIAAGQFRDIYIDLNSRSIAGTKVLVTDSGANGLHATGATVDMVDDGSGIFLLDGEWRDKDMSRSEYEEAAAEADAQYARMLSVLIEAAR